MFVFLYLFTSITIICLQFGFITAEFRHDVETDNINVTSVFTKDEVTALIKLREIVEHELHQDYMRTDSYLIRWIRDQNNDLEKAKEKLLKSLKWRKQNRVDSILQEDFTHILKNCPFDLSGRDMENRPVLTAGMGQCHIRKLILSGNQAKLNRAIIFLSETFSKLNRMAEKEGQNPQQGVIIADMNGLSVTEHVCLRCIPIFITILTVYQEHYPEMIKSIYVINTPRIGLSLVSLLLPFAPPNQRELFFAYGFDKSEWQAEILKIIKPDQLSPQFGGTKLSKQL